MLSCIERRSAGFIQHYSGNSLRITFNNIFDNILLFARIGNNREVLIKGRIKNGGVLAPPSQKLIFSFWLLFSRFSLLLSSRFFLLLFLFPRFFLLLFLLVFSAPFWGALSKRYICCFCNRFLCRFYYRFLRFVFFRNF